MSFIRTRPFKSTSILASCLALAASVGAQGSTEAPSFDWSSLTPSTNLSWVDCYQSPLQCARFTVPLNYSNPDAGDAALALIRVPSPMANTTSYKGPVLFNPGGPGGSGVQTVVGSGVHLQSLVGEEFDLVSFDPRGVENSTPTIEFWTPEEQENYFRTALKTYDISPASWSTLPEQLKNITASSEMIKERSEDLIQHVTSDNVARDMLSIVQAHGREKLQYYGIDYGSALGSVFASIFPDKVERILIDGVMDPDGFFTQNFVPNLVDADKTLQMFFEACIAGGPELCAFYEDTVQDLTKRWDTLYDSIAAGNFTLADNRTLPMQAFVPWAHSALYSPSGYPNLAQVLHKLENGTATFADVGIVIPGNTPQYTLAIRCTDSGPVLDTALEFEDYWNQLTNATEYFAAGVSVIRPSCYDWAIKPDHFKGPFGADNTSFPLMLIGNIADPAAPLSATKKTASLFPGSGVLTNNVPGHVSLGTPSKCVANYIHQYFVNGTLPEQGASCDLEQPIFASVNATTGA